MAEVYYTPESWLTQAVRIHVVGAGGTGSQVLDCLASLEATLVSLGHPGFEVTVYDPDTVSRSNLGRQRFTPADVGLSKAQVLCHRINQFYGRAWGAVFDYYDPGFELRSGPRAPQLIITCVDLIQTRVTLGGWRNEGHAPVWPGNDQETLWLDTGNGASTGQVILGHLFGQTPAGKRRLPNVLDLHPELETTEEADDGPSCSMEEAVAAQEWPINRAASMVTADLLWALFRHGSTHWHGATFGLNPLTTEPLLIDPVIWGLYGYDADALDGAEAVA